MDVRLQSSAAAFAVLLELASSFGVGRKDMNGRDCQTESIALLRRSRTRAKALNMSARRPSVASSICRRLLCCRALRHAITKRYPQSRQWQQPTNGLWDCWESWCPSFSTKVSSTSSPATLSPAVVAASLRRIKPKTADPLHKCGTESSWDITWDSQKVITNCERLSFFSPLKDVLSLVVYFSPVETYPRSLSPSPRFSFHLYWTKS
jgi:hypothetical protein